MSYRLGVIPAAGKATRWGDGTIKELLPYDGHKQFIDHTVEALGEVCDSMLVVTSPEKLPILANRTYGALAPPIAFTNQIGCQDMWSAMRTSLFFYADYYYMAMPDTLYPDKTFLKAPNMLPEAHFAMGCFWTCSSERFGMLRGERKEARIVNKPTEGGPGWAWGVLTWSRLCAYKWLSKGITNYTDAINYAIETYGLHTWEMDYYFDFANRAEYERYNLAIKRGGAFPQP